MKSLACLLLIACAGCSSTNVAKWQEKFSAGHPVITWTAQPFMSYSILRATNVLGPYLPVATGLTFNSPAGTYTDLTPVSSTVFYKIASP